MAYSALHVHYLKHELIISMYCTFQLLKHYENKDLPKHLVRQSQILTRDEEMALQRKRMADNQKGAKDLLISGLVTNSILSCLLFTTKNKALSALKGRRVN